MRKWWIFWKIEEKLFIFFCFHKICFREGFMLIFLTFKVIALKFYFL